MADNRKTVFITGCSSGIGRHLALAFKDNGLRVFATARKAETISDLADKGIETLSLTVDDKKSVEACYKELCTLLGPGKGLDYLFNNAGQNYTVPALDVSMNDVAQMFNTNVFAVMHINSVFIPLLLQTHGTIVHIGSVAGIFPYIWGCGYNASKAALHHYANTLRLELAPFGVHVLTIVTGGVRSNIARTQRSLPEGSLFSNHKAAYERRVNHSQEVGMDTRQYADQVVKGTLSARGWLWNSNEIWAGALSRMIWFGATLDWWIPGGIWRLVIPRMFGLNKRVEPPESKKRV